MKTAPGGAASCELKGLRTKLGRYRGMLEEICNHGYEQEHKNGLQDTHSQDLVVVHSMCH